MLCYREWVRWWACEYLQIQVWKHRGKPDPVKPTYRDVKLMPRLLLPFNQNWGEESTLFPSACLPACISFCLSSFLTLAAKQQTQSTSGLLLIIHLHSSSEDLMWAFTMKFLKCAREGTEEEKALKKGLLFWLGRHINHKSLFSGWRVIMSVYRRVW